MTIDERKRIGIGWAHVPGRGYVIEGWQLGGVQVKLVLPKDATTCYSIRADAIEAAHRIRAWNASQQRAIWRVIYLGDLANDSAQTRSYLDPSFRFAHHEDLRPKEKRK